MEDRVDFDNGRSVVIAYDHGTEGAIQGGEDLPAMLETIGRSSADGILLTVGAARHYQRWAEHRDRSAGAIVGLDIPVFGTRVSDAENLVATRQLWEPRDAVAAGATMCKMLLPLGLGPVSDWADALTSIAHAANDAHRAGLPIMLEPAFWGEHEAESDSAILDAARLCVELGADVLKIPAPHDLEVLRRLVSWSPVPVTVLGGKPRDGGDLIDEIAAWMNVGVAGIVVGRNVWNRPSPQSAIDSLSAVVHDGDPERAKDLMNNAGLPLSLGSPAGEED